MSDSSNTAIETQTLDDVLSKQGEWSDDEISQIIDGLRTQSEQWNANQLSGSKQRVTAKKIPLKPKTNFLKKKPS